MFIRDPATARIGEEILPFECGNVPEYFRKKAEAELHDSPDKRAQGLRQLKELIKKDKHTKHLEFEDDFLLQYLISKKYNIAKAFSFLKALVHLKKKHPEIFSGFSYEEISCSMSENVLTVLPWRCQDGCAILAAHLDNWDPEKLRIDDLKRSIAIYLLQSLQEPMTQINGFKVIIDAKSNPMKHLRYITPSNLYLLYHGTQECVPARYKDIHLVNESLTLKAAWFLVKPFLSDKIKKRVHFHSSNEDLLKFFPKSILPTEFGGELQNYDMYDWLRKATEPAKLEVLGGRPRQS
ncbi:retinaldehyde-binding protein 1-like isoform X1 [Argiope bruennichi]|uniref:retinaldehyde-binding protein 1-like isoform X1 n=1 Tax=Argiope bruennichi TaxID=94029 RepID=UPI002495A106|nr:retinaldehyde-binding protein 1-like isoform X1 [Argiope bruennichi]XP_055944750.1 retinaldehyde-binding protein 1-like isoform X1 [Argiope bruennichi]